MTKFEELNKIFTKSGEEFINYRWKCIEFAKNIGNNLAKYLECNEEDIQYYLYDKDGKPMEAHPRDALVLSNDTFWHYGMGINLYPEGSKNPAPPFIFHMAVKGDKDKFTVQLPDLKKEFDIRPDNPENFKPINDLIFNTIKDRFENQLEKFLKHQSMEHYPEYM
jgi:hypothetical protein